MKICRKSAVIALALLAGVGAAGAATMDSVPKSGQLAFDVIRKGRDIGDYVLKFGRSGDELTVKLATKVLVKVPVIGVAAYRFEQNSAEHWRSGRLTALSATTDDNGTAHDISVGATGLMPASLWNAGITDAAQILNTIDGSVDRIAVRNLGEESVETGHGTVQARHYAISGDLNRDLWFDGSGTLVHVRFAAEDGSQIDYVLR